MKLSYVRVLVDKFPECYAFYHDVLGLKTIWGDPQNVYAEFEVGEGTRLALFKRELSEQALGLAGGAGAGRRFVVVLEVDDVDQKVAEISGRGAKAAVAAVDRPDWSVRTAHYLDPDGNLIEVNTPLKK